MNGVLVGELCREPGGVLAFTYAPSWLSDVRATPVSLSSKWVTDCVSSVSSPLD